MSKAKRILIADDEAADVGLIEIVVGELGLQVDIAVASTGEDVLDYLYCRGKYGDRPAGGPELILLDLKLPKISGLEILQQMRADKQFREVPVVVFSSSLDETDREKSFSYGAIEFIAKPFDFDAFGKAIQKIVTTYISK